LSLAVLLCGVLFSCEKDLNGNKEEQGGNEDIG